MGISINTALENNLISKNNMSNLITKCRCGNDLEFSSSLRELRCPDKNCKYKTVDRIKSFINKLDIELNETDILSLIDELNIVTPYQLLTIYKAFKSNNDIVKNIVICNKNSFLQSMEKVFNNEYFIYEIAELCGIQKLEIVAYKIFNGFDSFEEAYEEIDNGQVAFLNERLGIKNQDSTIISYEIYSVLNELREELIFAESQLNLHTSTKQKLNIAINDNVLPFLNVGEFIDWLNYTYPKYRFNHVVTISDTTDILVKNYDEPTVKIRIMRLLNDKHVAELMNNNKLELNNIGKFTINSLKPLGSKIYADTLENIVDRLNKFK